MTHVQETPNGILINGKDLERDGMSLRGRPMECCTFLCGGEVIKIEFDRKGFSQPEAEAYLWPLIEPQDRIYFAAVLDSGTLEDGRHWITKEYHDLKHEGELDEELFDEHLLPLVEKYKIFDVDPDWNCAISINTGLPIIFDWGLNGHG